MLDTELLALTADIVSSHVSNNSVATVELPKLIQSVYAALAQTAESAPEPAAKQEPAVSVRSSIKPDYIVCLEDGAKLKMLKRYLRTRYNMSPEDYRAKWGLPRDYPMVAPNYAEQRRTLAHTIGLGRKKAEEVLSEPAAVVPEKPARGRPKKAASGTEALKASRARGSKAPVEQVEQAEPAEGANA